MIKKSLLVGCGSLLLFLLISFPLILRFGSSVFADPNWPFDTYGTLYGIWWLKFAFQQGLSSGVNSLLAHPFGLDWSQLPVQPMLTYPLLLFALIGGEIFSYNLFVLLNFALTGAITFALCYYCTNHVRGSLLGALIYTFAPNHMLQTMSHLGFSATQWIPLFILSWLYLWRERNGKGVLFCTMSTCFLFWSNYYFFYFSLFFVILYFVIAFWHREDILWQKMPKLLVLTSLLCGVLLAPQWIPLAQKVFSKNPTPEMEASGYVRSQKDLIKYAARPSDYLLPSEYHPILSKATLWFQKKLSIKGRHWSDRTLYLGFFPLLLAGMLFFFRRRFSNEDRFTIRLSLFCLLFFIWFSLPPWISLGKIPIPTPSSLLYPIFPMFRYYSRAGFMVSLFLAILVAFTWKYFPLKFSSKQAKNWVCGIAACFILFEFSVVPPTRNLDFSTVPKVYQWLKEQPGDFAVVEYPFVRSIKEEQQRYAFYQRVHGKRLVNGGDPGTLSDMLRKKAQEIESPELWSLLSYYGTRYAIVHHDGELFEDIPSLKLIKKFEREAVFQIQSDSKSVHTILWNFGQALTRSDGKAWRWIGQTARVWCLNTKKKKIPVRLRFRAFSPQENKLQILLNKREIFTIEVPGGEQAAFLVDVPNLMLSPGENLIQFIPQRLVAHPENQFRKVSFCVSEIQLKEKSPLQNKVNPSP